MKKGIIAIIFIMLMGLFFIAFYVISEIQYTNLMKIYKECEAIVTNVSVDYNRYNVGDLKTVHIKYTVDGTEYSQELSTNTGLSFGKVATNFDIGDITTIYYNPQNPSQIATQESNKTGMFIAIFGIVAFVFGTILLIIVIRKYRQMKH
jgi:heme/copper-type cytochrome/quinol oxidase subunit 2